MSPPEAPEDSSARRDESRRDEVFGRYLDRLNAGEVLDAEEIRKDHPEFAEEIIEQLKDFEAFGAEGRKDQRLGAFGGYDIVRELGRGGMGVVYEAIDNAMDRRVALKILPAGLMIQEKAVVRFRREARMAAQLQHPNVVAVYATGIADKTPYIAMEFVEGETLARILEQKRPAPAVDSRSFGSKILTGIARAFSPSGSTTVVPPPSGEPPPEPVPTGDGSRLDLAQCSGEMDLSYSIRMARSFAAVAEGLEHAHSKGIIHRDLKPSNLILDRQDNLRILDFGLARLEGQESLTASGDVVGTPRYMSPEQARSFENPVDHRTDIYSLGATLYEMLTLAPPFQGRTPQETLAQIIQREPRPLRALNPRVPRDLETIVLKCLEKNPADRYGTAEALAQDLRRFTRGDPIEARPQSLGEKISRRVRRHRGKIALAAAFLVLLLAVFWLYHKRQDDLHRLRVAQYDRQVVDAVVKMQMSGALADSLGTFAGEGTGFDMRPLSKGLDFSLSATDIIASAVKSLEDAARAVPERSDARYHLARGQLALGNDARAMEVLQPAIASGFVPAICLGASIAQFRGDQEQSRRLLEQAARSGEGTWAEAWLAAQLASAERRWQDAAAAYEKLIEMEKLGHKPYLGSSVEMYLGCGMGHLELQEYERARENFVAAGAVWPGAVEPELFLAVTAYSRGDKEGAEATFEKLYKRSSSDEVVNLIVMLYYFRFSRADMGLKWAEQLQPGYSQELWRATLLSALGRNQEALEVGKKLPDLNPRAVLSYFIPAMAFISGGRFAEAEALVKRAAELAPESAAPLALLANIFRLQGKMRESFEMLMKASEVEPGAALPHYYIGMALAAQGMLEEAARSMEKAAKLTTTHKSGPYAIGDPHLYLGEILRQLGRMDESRAAFKKAIELAPSSAPFDPERLVLLARARFVCGDAAGAVRTLEGVLEHPGISPGELAGIESDLETYAEAALPDLPTYRSVDAALASLDREPIIKAGAVWRFFRGREAPSPGLEWATPEYDDAAWESGPAGFGYGDGDDATVLGDMENNYTTVYIRRQFTLEDTNAYPRLILSVKADDGFVAYLNGKEVLRHLAGEAAVVPHDALASGAAPEPAEAVEAWIEPAASLRAGKNVLALQGLNVSIGSSDFSLLPALDGELKHDPARGEKLQREFRGPAAARGEEAEGRLAYLEGRLLAREGKHEEALKRFAVAAGHDPARPEPCLAQAESLRALGEQAAAAVILGKLLPTASPGAAALWESWAVTSFAGLGRRPGELLAEFPAKEGGAAGAGMKAPGPASRPAEDLRWLLEELEKGNALRINCGGKEYVSAAGVTWSRDRFYTSGGIFQGGQEQFTGEIAGTSDDPLYQTERYFSRRRLQPEGYRIPLPRGSYRVTLHFAEIWHKAPARRAFDVSIEGKRVLDEYDPGAAGFATAEAKSFEVAVDDGLLNIDFTPKIDFPKISALKIESSP